ncbi:MAG: class F sortase, partial [Nitriliruptor sp.]
TRVERFDRDAFPTEAVYSHLDHVGLRLITCGGEFDRQPRSYRDNLVAFAALIGQGAGG